MRTGKQRLTITVDAELIEEGRRAIEAGRADSVSGWVSSALEERVRRDRQLAELATAVGDHEKEFGEITTEEIAAQKRADRTAAIVVRGPARPPENRDPHDPRPR